MRAELSARAAKTPRRASSRLSELLGAEPERALALPDAVGRDARHFKQRFPTRTRSGIHDHLRQRAQCGFGRRRGTGCPNASADRALIRRVAAWSG